MAHRNVEWYSVHTNSVALREMARHNVEHYFCHASPRPSATQAIGTPIKAFRYQFDWKMSKLISLICFDIFQSKWYRNALIANTIFGTQIKAFRYHFYFTHTVLTRCQNCMPSRIKFNLCRVTWLVVSQLSRLKSEGNRKCITVYLKFSLDICLSC